jgi:hypothetical protein
MKLGAILNHVRFMTAADLLLTLTTAYAQNNLKAVMHRAIKS